MNQETEAVMQSRDYYQEIEESGDFQSSGAIDRHAMLNLNNPFTITEPPPVPSSSERCTMCGSYSAAKRRSSSSLQEPTPKKQLLTLIASPPSASNLPPILRLCVSDPTNSPGPTNATQFLNPQSPAKWTASLPPITRVLRRSVSDPTSTPPRGPPRTSLQSPNSTTELGSESIRRESPNSKMLKSMKDHMREMIQWLDEFVHEDGGCEGNNNTEGEGCECAETTEAEEAVSVERTGEGLIIHFKCPCNKAHQILLSGKNYYYKLI